MSNVNYIHDGFQVLLPVLHRLIRSVFKGKYGDNWLIELNEAYPLSNREQGMQTVSTPDEVLDACDMQMTITIIDKLWSTYFKATNLSRSYLNEVREVRNRAAHIGTSDFSDDDTVRALDTMARIVDKLEPEKSEGIRAMIRDLRYTDPGASQLPMASKARTKRENEAIVVNGQLPAWRNVMKPNADVAADRYKNADFAANLGEVANGTGAQEYADPVDFFHKTYLTHGMKQLLIQAIRRVTTGNGDPVIQLKTSFGGGKTHTLLTLYHLMRQMVPADKMRGVAELLNDAGVDKMPRVNVAALYCVDFEPTKSRRPANLPGVTVNTMWGEIAAQLAISAGRPELYDFVKESDKKGVSPGREVLRNLLDACGPCMILIDEFVAYARKLYKKDGLPAGSFDNLMTFVQELAEAAATSKNSLVVASIPESDVEIGTEEGGKIALQSIEKYFGRLESVWTPVEPTESFEIVRRRLFQSCDDNVARELVCEEFSRMYVAQKDDFPAEARELNYKKRLIDCYPIHPDVFDKLYQVWATIEGFQRTRGVLRYMAGVVHYLWEIGDASPLIMPWSMPFCDVQVSGELIKHLGANNIWQPIISKEIDGSQSIPNEQDNKDFRLGQLNASRRVTRMIMFSTAPSVRFQKVRGITKKEIHLGVCMPGESMAAYNDALERLTEKLAYLYSDTMADTHYWFDTRPTLRKMMQDRMAQIDADAVVDAIRGMMQNYTKKTSTFDVHVFPGERDKVTDDQKLHLVVLNPSQTHSGRDSGHLRAVNAAKYHLDNCGNSPRRNKNMLLFLAPDNESIETVKINILQKLAWESIRSDSDKNIINLGKIEIEEISKNIKKLNDVIDSSLSEAYSWLLVPENDESSNELHWENYDIRGQQALMDRISKQISENEIALTNWAPRFLNDLLNKLYWRDDRTDLEIKTLWQNMTSYCYMKRLVNFDVLKACIEKGIGDYFGYSSGSKNENGQYIGLTLGKTPIDASGFIVKLDVASAQLDAERLKREAEERKRREREGLTDSGGSGSTNTGNNDNPPATSGNGTSNGNGDRPFVVPKAPPVKVTEYYASKKIDSARLSRELKAEFIRQVVEEIVANLEGEVDEPIEITLDIKASNQRGFSQSTVRVITENARVLGFDTSEFE